MAAEGLDSSNSHYCGLVGIDFKADVVRARAASTETSGWRHRLNLHPQQTAEQREQTFPSQGLILKIKNLLAS